ncbi:hypothetical protein EVJ58_g4368 [Rhodofomes roseus]|uniref:Fungal-type protein kinase domain-containing protein n=1 Tax=Rhodofomes roseus TaxID=34475 RepID=A0A4Y9YJ00_9APHY|nr:hypothetical protein EVJ58_g4368 [Rhodofomes roseus]
MSDQDSIRVKKSDAQPLIAYHAQQKSDVNEDRWNSEIFRTIIGVEDPLDAFVQKFVPSIIHHDPLSSPLTFSYLSARSDSARRDSDAHGPARSPSSDSSPMLTPSPPPEESEESTPLGDCTVSGWCHAGQKYQLYGRSHMGMVLETAASVSLSQFKNTLKLVIALCDAIEGHERAYDAGIIHKDVSEGNVMIVRRETGSGSFLQDFDHAFSWKHFLRRPVWHATKESWKVYVRTGQGLADPAIRVRAEDAQAVEERKRRHDCKERTDTAVHFMAMDVVRGGITQDVRHDLESFYWLQVWMLLRYAEHEHRNGIQAYQKLFGGDSDDIRGGQKMWWLVRQNALTIKNNTPLDHLLEQFRSICCNKNIPQPTLPDNSMSHDEVLRIFHEALEMEGWPEDDAARDYPRPQSDKDQEQLFVPRGP